MRIMLYATLSLAALAPTAHAVVVINDTFDSPASLTYHSFTPGSSAGVVHGPAGDYLSATAAPNSRFGASPFPAVTLTQIGDRLTFRYRLQAAGSGTGPQPLLDLRVGVYHSGGTSPTDGSPASRDAAADDRGYRLNAIDDPGLFYSGTFGNDVTGSTLSDYEGGQFTGPYRFADGPWHSVEISLQRTATGITSRVLFDGVEKINNPGLVNGVYTFDNLQFGTGNAPMEIHLDDIAVEFTPVPEPSLLSIAGVGAAFLAARRRR